MKYVLNFFFLTFKQNIQTYPWDSYSNLFSSLLREQMDKKEKQVTQEWQEDLKIPLDFLMI